jgi:3-oxoacid CoA-transferase B subunit
MDLAACAKRVFIAMEHTTRDGSPKMLKRCQLPITAPGAVTMVATDLGLFLITDQGFELTEHAPGWTIAEIQELTEAQFSVATDFKEFQLRD